jgi:hypothetical protein
VEPETQTAETPFSTPSPAQVVVRAVPHLTLVVQAAPVGVVDEMHRRQEVRERAVKETPEAQVPQMVGVRPAVEVEQAQQAPQVHQAVRRQRGRAETVATEQPAASRGRASRGQVAVEVATVPVPAPRLAQEEQVVAVPVVCLASAQMALQTRAAAQAEQVCSFLAAAPAAPAW